MILRTSHENNFNHYSRFFYSYQPIEEDGPNNGELGTDKNNMRINEDDTYYYWFETYPIEYGEFLLDSALARGVYFHTMAANDAFYERHSTCHYFYSNCLQQNLKKIENVLK